MTVFLKSVCVITFALVCSSKDLHIKEDRDSIEKDYGLPSIYKNNGMPQVPQTAERERFVRHVEMTVTETVLQHLMNEINKKYPETRPGAKNSTMPKLIRKLKSKLRKQIKKNKNMKHKKISHSKAHTKAVENSTISLSNVV